MKASKSLTPQDLEHFQYLVESKCSMRSHAFICAILEPECRPERMVPFMPCKRICKCMTNWIYIHTYCAVAFWKVQLIRFFSLLMRQPFWRLVHTLWHHLKCWRLHSTVTSIPIQRMKTNAKIRPEAPLAIQRNFNAPTKRAFHRNGGTINYTIAFAQSKATNCTALYLTLIHTRFRCDNIKDCSNAEDEAACTFCAQDEFK